MGSVCGDYCGLSRRQMLSKICELSRENNCLKSDLIRLEMLSNECQKYLHFLSQTHDTTDTSIENNFIKQMNDLKDIKKFCIVLNEVSNSDLNEKYLSIGCQTSDVWLEPTSPTDDNTRHERQDQTLNAYQSDTDCQTNCISIEDHLRHKQVFEGSDTEIESHMNANKCDSSDVIRKSYDNNFNYLNTMTKRLLKSIQIHTKLDNKSNEVISNHKSSLNSHAKVLQSIGCQTCDDLMPKYDITRHMQSNNLNETNVSIGCQTSDDLIKWFIQTKDNTNADEEDVVIIEDLGNKSSKCGDNRVIDVNTDVESDNNMIDGLDNSKTLYVCDYQDCKKSFACLGTYYTHQRLHLGDNCLPFNCGFNECFKSFASIEALRRHQKVHTSSDTTFGPKKTYRCRYGKCRKKFVSKDNLKRHVLAVHPVKRFFCNYGNCSAHFGLYSEILAHMRAADHRLNQPFVCQLNECQFKTTSRANLEDHLISHPIGHSTSGQRFVCDVMGCDKRFSKRDNLSLHKRVVHKLQKPSHFNTNCKTNLNDKPLNQLTDKTKCKSNLSQHTKKLSKSYKCNKCGKTFGNAIHLRQHNILNDCSLHMQFNIMDQTNGDELVANERSQDTHNSEVNDNKTLLQYLLTTQQSVFVCRVNGCQFKTTSLDQLTAHKSSHITRTTAGDHLVMNNTFKNKTQCPESQQKSSHKTDIASLDVMNLDIIYKCASCSQTFTTITDLNAHNMTAHAFKNHQLITKDTLLSGSAQSDKSQDIQWSVSYVCQDCQQTFGTIIDLNDHNINTHNGSALNVNVRQHIASATTGSDARQGFDYITNLLPNQVMRPNISQNERPYKCQANGCNQTFKNQKVLNFHNTRNHGCPNRSLGSAISCVKCQLDNCLEVFDTEEQLTIHQLRLHPDQFPDLQWIKCVFTGCNYMSKYVPDAYQHTDKHSIN